MAELLPYKNGYYLWHYVPSLPGGIVFIVLFFLAAFIHTFRMFRHQAWFHIPFIIGCLFEAVGYIGFTIAHDNTDKLIPYVMQSLLILIAPALFAASIYMILGRLITRLPSGPAYSIIRPQWLTRIFVCGDVASFLIQCSGGGMMAGEGNQNLGRIIIIVGLFAQIVMFGLFVVAAVTFHVRYGASRSVAGEHSPGIPWLKVLRMLYAVSLMIMVRSVFRVIEYVWGQNGYPLTHEWTLFVFDSSLMFLVTVMFYVMYHPDDIKVGLVSGYTDIEAPSSMEIPIRQK